MVNPFSISSITIAKPNVPLRDKQGRADFRASDFKIWQSAYPNEFKPVSISIDSSQEAKIYVAFDGPIPPDRSYTLSGKFLSKFPGKEAVIKTNLIIEDAEFNSTTGAVPVTVKGCPNNAPWGVQDTIEWSIVGEILTETPIELYAITPHELLPEYLQGEIPSELLEVFVLPTTNLEINHESYVKYVVAICFKSTEDKEPIESDDEVGKRIYGEITPVHSYVYNHLYGGGSSFTNGGGGNFRLTDWLKNRNEIPKREIHFLNCFDQAGLVSIVSSLGLVDSGTKLLWYWMEPYGYIDANLVGCGKCNNPYFGEKLQGEDDAGNKTQADTLRQTKDHSPRRSGFTQHVFAAIKSGQEEPRILDACAGPHFGTQTLEEYIKDAIKTKDIPPTWDNKERIEEGTRTKYTEAGISKNADCVSSKTGKEYGIDKLDANHQVLYPIDFPTLSKDKQQFLDELEKRSKIEGVESDDRMKNVNLNLLADKITEKLRERNFDGSSKSNSNSRTSLEWKGVGAKGETIIVEMSCYESYKSAFSFWNAHFLSFSEPDTPIKTLHGPTDEGLKVNHYLAGADSVQWIDSHILVKVSARSGNGTVNTDLKDIAQDILDLMSKAAEGHSKDQERGLVNLRTSISTPVVVGSEFSITVEVPQGCIIQALLEPNKTIILMDKEPISEGNTRCFRFRAISEGKHKVNFICSHWETFEISVQECEVNVPG